MVFLRNKPILLPLFDYKVDRVVHATERFYDPDEAKRLKQRYSEIRDKIFFGESLNEDDLNYVDHLNKFQ